MSSDKAQYQALSLHTVQQQPLNALYRANGRLLAAREVEHVTIGQKVYSTAQLAEMAAMYEAMRAPLTEAEQAEADTAAERVRARREVVQAAIRARNARGEVLEQHVFSPNDEQWEREVMRAERIACDDLDRAVDAFLAAGGSEVMG